MDKPECECGGVFSFFPSFLLEFALKGSRAGSFVNVGHERGTIPG